MKKQRYKFLVEFLTESLEQADALIKELKENVSFETKKRVSAEREIEKLMCEKDRDESIKKAKEREIYKLELDIKNLRKEKAELMQELESYREGA
ncbi:hypothetical protein [Eubacterium sp.]|uniref:hypothetical protein n=1 Tax=Eubacterium sp. TaxID=142586 RepID=UPI0026DFE5AB|nr:hypothetical protein [Eubacterium sp.]MDO5433351.1 hypothetical protein [Eubacterium sp.]